MFHSNVWQNSLQIKKKKEKKKNVTSSVYKMNCLSVSTSILSYVIQNIVDVTQLITLTSEMKR